MSTKTSRRNAYRPTVPMANQAVRPLENEEGSGVCAPNPVLLGKPNSMRQSELNEYQCAGYECGECGRVLKTEHGRGSHIAQTHPGTLPWTDEGLLRELFVEEGLSAYQIAEKWGCSHQVVSEWIGEFNIKRPSPPWEDKEVLERLYVEQDRSQRVVGNILGCSQGTIGNWLREHGIETRNHAGRVPIKELSERRILRDLYVEQKFSVWQLGDKLGVNGRTVWWWLHYHGIETRGYKDGDQVRELLLGRHRSGQWEKQRKKALERDGYACRWCRTSESEHEEVCGRSLDVHHIIPYSSFDDPKKANVLGNLFTVCRSCHMALEGKGGGE